MPPALQRENGLLQLELKLEREEVARLKAEVTSLAANGAGHQVAIERLEAAARATAPPRCSSARLSRACARARALSKTAPSVPLAACGCRWGRCSSRWARQRNKAPLRQPRRRAPPRPRRLHPPSPPSQRCAPKPASVQPALRRALRRHSRHPKPGCVAPPINSLARNTDGKFRLSFAHQQNAMNIGHGFRKGR